MGNTTMGDAHEDSDILSTAAEHEALPEQRIEETMAQDEPPRVEREWSASEISRLARVEAAQQRAIRGPILLRELVPEGTPEEETPRVYYRRLTANESDEINERFQNSKSWASILIDRALDANGKQMFNRTYLTEMDSTWNALMIERVVVEIGKGSKTQLTDAQLGKS